MIMDASELATKMLAWEKSQRANDDLKAEIEEAILLLSKTQSVGNVICKFRKGNTSRDYPGSGKDADPAIIAKHTSDIPLVPATTKTDWKKVCKDASIEATITNVADNKATLQLAN